jgi:hypothetical protein
MLPTALVAVVGTAAILFNDFNPNADSQGGRKRHGDHGRGGVQARRDRDSVRIARWLEYP